ncbi:hypothetical protein KIM67_13760 [Flagellimonas sp. 389]|uniref:hypothetical protein n=1 Tax=Flagellimonas sp. 389 TaxID=2835862 RepID=UPI001BD42E4E|nr:hypothetical protein [Flagellimonas sp. 389]MBS9463479.1 hypothetical protein [Flagellimonas sp. 389]
MVPKSNDSQTSCNFYNRILLVAFIVFNIACGKDETKTTSENEEESTEEDGTNTPTEENFDADVNKDGTLNILLLGPSKSINSSTQAFSLASVTEQLNNILSQDNTVTTTVNIEYEDTYREKIVNVGLGSSASNQIEYTHYAHSLVQYYYWPDGQENRMSNLKGDGEKDWDYVVIAADPYIVSKIPGFYSLGVNKIATKITEGSAKPLLLMQWPKSEQNTTSISNFEDFTYRTAAGALVDLEVVPAGLAWQDLSSELKDEQSAHPSPNGAYLTAAAIYAHIYNENPSISDYIYNDALADAALSGVKEAKSKTHFSGEHSYNSPFKSGTVNESIIRYNHTGSSTENGIIGGLNWVIAKVDGTTLQRDGAATVNFNLGRANTNFETNKRYKIDAGKFNFSIGFPMQDGSVTGDTSMLYGIDKRGIQSENGTDLGVALYMIRENELPTARAVPIRALYAQMKELNITDSAYRDNWHMSRDLDKAIGG